MKTQLLALLAALALSPASALAQTATPSVYTAGFNNFPVTSEFGSSLGNAIGKDPKGFCNDVGLGNNTNSSESTMSSYDKGSKQSSSSGGGGGSVDSIFGSIGGSGSKKSASSNSWDIASASGSKTTTSTVVQGKDCSEVVKTAGAMEINRINNETNRYDIDTRRQIALREIEVGQVQSVFGGGAKSMLGDFGR